MVLLAALGTGVMVGWLVRSRWILLAAPFVFVLVFELVRARVDGPTVDGISVEGIYGVIALIGGRGVDAVLMLLPLAVGCGWGLLLARRSGPSIAGGSAGRQLIGRGALAVGTAAVVVLTAGLLRPASTDDITGADGEAVAGSVADLVEVSIGGHDQHLMLRGVSAQAPVLLFLEGGPGGTGIGRIRNAGEDLEQNFVVATWDQRGTGKSYAALEPTSTLTVEQMVEDTLEVTRYLRDRFGVPKVHLVGSSWGTIIGTLAVQDSPELFHAYVGTGQMVDPFETDRSMYAESLRDAEARGDDGAADALRDIGPPPYENTLDYPVAISSNPKWLDFRHGDDYNARSEYPASLFVGEYTLVEQLRAMAAIAETYDVLYPQLDGTDFREQVPRLDVPVLVVAGRHEAVGRETLAREWFAALAAPSKQYVVFDRSGHTPPYDEPGRFADLMSELRASVEAGAP